MDWLEDSKDCLTVAKSMLNEIQGVLQQSVLKDKPPSSLKVTIKNFLENIRSSLEYSSVYIFDTYCSSNYNEKELEKKKIYFPIRKTYHSFEICIKNDFRGLQLAKPEVYHILKDCQPFNDQKWILHLNILSNKNKHIRLSNQKCDKKTKVAYLEDLNGNKIINFTACGYGGNGVIINGIPLTQPNPFIKSLNATIEVEYLFEEINQPIIPTLVDIYRGAVTVINKLESIL